MKYSKDFSIVYRLIGIVGLVFILMTNYFKIPQTTKILILRFGILLFIMLLWRFFEEKKRKSQPIISLVFYGIFFIGILNTFLKIIILPELISYIAIVLFFLTACIEIILLFKNKFTKFSDILLFSLLGIFSFITLTPDIKL